jgi:hypothetical protein
MSRVWPALAVASIIAVAGCGPPALTCNTISCPTTSTKTYQECINIDASIAYNFGGMSCHCSAASCSSCSQMIATYCSGGGGGSGGSGGGGSGGSGGGGGGNNACSIMLSGAVSGSFGCSALTVYSNANNAASTTLSVASPAPLQSLTVNITRPGMPTTGFWSSADAGSTAVLAAQQSSGATWQASVGGAMAQGSYTMNITVGNGTATGNGMTYMSATGNISGTLPAVTGSGASGSVTLSATF